MGKITKKSKPRKVRHKAATAFIYSAPRGAFLFFLANPQFVAYGAYIVGLKYFAPSELSGSFELFNILNSVYLDDESV